MFRVGAFPWTNRVVVPFRTNKKATEINLWPFCAQLHFIVCLATVGSQFRKLLESGCGQILDCLA